MHPAKPALLEVARQVRERAGGVDLTTVNEANTKALFIEPLLQALGWDVLDMAAVTREYQVHDGTYLDYALLASGRPALFVEAKPTRKSLLDPKWVSQTINYANNEGVVWCVLTDGLRWRVFKANEAAPMADKLAFEVSIEDLFDDDTRGETEHLFSHLTPQAIAEGELSRLGTQVFVDTRVRQIMLGMLEEPSPALIKAIRKELPTDNDLRPADIKGALTRVLKPALVTLQDTIPTTKKKLGVTKPEPTTSIPVEQPQEQSPPREASYTEKLERWPEAKRLHDSMKPALSMSGATINEVRMNLNIRYNGQYAGGIEARKTGLMIRVMMTIDDVERTFPTLKGRLRDVRGKGHWARGNTEILLDKTDDIPLLVSLLEANQT